MHDPWTDKLSDYIDGALDISEARQVELHLSSCDACAATLHELEAVVAVARSLEPREPARDLWAGIAAGIGATASGDVRPADRDIVSIADRRPRAARSFTFTMPQLAAAAVLLMTISASAVWMATRDASTGDVAVAMQGTILQNAAPVTAPVRLVDSRAAAEDEEYRSLAALLEETRESLDPATVEVLERSLESIQSAIAAAEAALAADPGNSRLQRQLDSTLQRRQELAARVSRVHRGGA